MSSSGDIVFEAEKKPTYQTLDLSKLQKTRSGRSSANLSEYVESEKNILRKKTFEDVESKRDRSSSDVFASRKITRRSAEYASENLHESTKESAEKTADLIEHLLQVVPTAMDVLSAKKICVSREKYDYLKKEYFRLKDESERKKKPPLPSAPPPVSSEKRYNTVSLQNLSDGHVKQVQKRFLPGIPVAVKKRTCTIDAKLRRWRLSSLPTDTELLYSGDILGEAPKRSGQMQSPEWMETLRRVVVCQSACRRLATRKMLKIFLNRSKVLNELLQTERSYIHQLHVLMDLYALPLIDKKVAGVDISHIRNGFTNLQSIVACNESFFVELQTCVNNDFVTDNAPYYIPVPKMGQLMSKYCVYMKCYIQYVIYFDAFITELTKMWEKKGAFSDFLTCQKPKNDTRMDFDALLTVAIQRIPRYTLLLNELAKKSPLLLLGKKEFDFLHKAVRDFDQLGHTFNEAKRNAEFTDRIKHIADAFSPRQRSELKLIQPFRKLIAEGFLFLQDAQQKQPVHLILFSDLILVVNRNCHTNRTLRRKKSLENVLSENEKWKSAVVDIDSPALVGAEEISEQDKRHLFKNQKTNFFGRARHHESLSMIALVELSPKMSVRGLEQDSEAVFENAFVFDALKISYAFSAPSASQRNNWLMHFENVLREIH